VLDVDGAVEKSKLDEFRNNNIALTTQLAETKRRFEGIESEQVKAVAAERDALNSKLTAIQIDQGVTAAAAKKGLRSLDTAAVVLPELQRSLSANRKVAVFCAARTTRCRER